MVTFLPMANYSLLIFEDIHATNIAHKILLTIFYTYEYTCTSDFNFNADNESHYSKHNGNTRDSTISTQTLC